MEHNETRQAPSKTLAGAKTELDTHIQPDNSTVFAPIAAQASTPRDEQTQIAPLAEQPAPQKQASHLGVIKDRFELVKSIGSGGMGDVFLARDLVRIDMDDNQPYIAIKVLKGNFSTMREAAQALQREAKKAQLLSHPNIVTVYDFDRDKDLVFITMEYLEGQSLEDYLTEHGSMPAAQAVKTIEAAAEGLAYAHKKGYVHADIKPANIFLTKDGGVKILDFGIAQAVRASEEELSAGESWTKYALTPSYASPEMIDHQDLHPSDDIYGLGIVFHELLTGSHPFTGSNNKAIPADKALKMGLKYTPLKNLSRRHNAAMTTALNFNGAKRYQDASELLKGLRPANKLKGALIASLATAIIAIAVSIVMQTVEPPPPELDDLPDYLSQTRELIIEADAFLETGEIGMAHRLYAQSKNSLDKTDEVAPKDSQTALFLLQERRARVIEALFERLKDNSLSSFQLKEIQLALEYLYNDELTEDKNSVAQQLAQLKKRLNSEDSE